MTLLSEQKKKKPANAAGGDDLQRALKIKTGVVSR